MTPSRWPSQLQAQLVGAANAADRANRPTAFVLLPGIALVIALVVLLIAVTHFTGARRDLQIQQQEWVLIQTMVEDLKKRRDTTPDLANMFPPLQQGVFDARVDAIAKRVWSDTPDRIPVRIEVTRKSSFVTTKVDLVKMDVPCTLNTVQLDKLQAWIDGVLKDRELHGVFVSRLDLRPTGSGWSGQVVFRRYEYLPPNSPR